MNVRAFEQPVAPVGIPSKRRSVAGLNLRFGILIVVVATIAGFTMSRVPSDWLGWESSRVLLVGCALFLCLGLAILSARDRALYARNAAFAFWAFFLISERLFLRDRVGTIDNPTFSLTAYAEGFFWIASLLVVLPVSLTTPHYFKRLFSGHYKWVSLFLLSVLFACSYSPLRAFSLAWAMKLVLSVLLLKLCMFHIHDFDDVISFMKFTFWAFAFLALEPLMLWFVGNPLYDEEGRMATVVSSDGLSAVAGTLYLLALALYWRDRGVGLRRAAIFVGLAGFGVMVTAGGKAGTVAGIVSGSFYFLLRKGFGSTVRFLAGALVVGSVLILSSPLSHYLRNYSTNTDNGFSNFTGRTAVWEAAWPAILKKPILGHGYLSATFVAQNITGLTWTPTHLHNGFLEVMYNNGLVGLVLMVMIHVVIVLDLIRALRRAPPDSFSYQVCVGCLAVYVNLLINGMFNASFGGRAWSFFMILLSMVVIAEKLATVRFPPEPRTRTRLA
jgi:O-antigen ligase